MEISRIFDQIVEATISTACAARQSVEKKDLRQALAYSRVSERLVHLQNDSAVNLRLRVAFTQQGAAHTPILDLVRSLASGNPSTAEYSLEQTIGILEEYTPPDDARASAPTQLPPEVSPPGSAKKLDLEQYSNATTKTLHETFCRTTILPCSCQDEGVAFRLFDQHDCALRLDGTLEVLGDKTHYFFDSVVARKSEQKRGWTHIQFQLPRDKTRFRFLNHDNNPSRDLPPDSYLVEDICRIVQSRAKRIDHRIPLRLKGSIPDHKLYELQSTLSHDCPQNDPPISLSEARKKGLLSAKNKMHIAFALSKSFWQYYESDWMQAKWTIETILLLPQRKDPNLNASLNEEAKTPFLKIDAFPIKETSFNECEPEEPSGERHQHPYPYLLNLGLLLFLLCSDDITFPDNLSSPAEPSRINEVYFKCVSGVYHERTPWPSLDLSEAYREQYRNIVKHCVPQLFGFNSKAYLTAAERRTMLKDNIVLPLYRLVKSMEDPDRIDTPERAGILAITGADADMDNIVEGPSELSRKWIKDVTSSLLQFHIINQLKINRRGSGMMRRPRVAIIDTGYDSSPRLFNSNKHKNRLNLKSERYPWKDFWDHSDKPQDDDGHGTSMLSIIMRVAPFADICVARVAGLSNDLHENAPRTSKNLAEAIEWATTHHQVDIISMSLGWEAEELFEGRHVVSNAIAKALDGRDQKVLFFAAASNFGGGRHELFPAKHAQVFSIRATDARGAHQNFNPALPERGEAIYGTLGVGVPSASKGRTEVEIGRNGTSVATAVAAGIAANIIGYINTSDDESRRWENIRTYNGFKNMLDKISTVKDTQKRFISLERFYDKNWKDKFEADLNSARWDP